jgi:hypothetical protein
MEDQIIFEIKQYINDGDLASIKKNWENYEMSTVSVAWDFVFQKIYIHACIRNQKHIIDWLDILFMQFDPITKIALRQMFAYSKYVRNDLKN